MISKTYFGFKSLRLRVYQTLTFPQLWNYAGMTPGRNTEGSKQYSFSDFQSKSARKEGTARPLIVKYPFQ